MLRGEGRERQKVTEENVRKSRPRPQTSSEAIILINSIGRQQRKILLQSREGEERSASPILLDHHLSSADLYQSKCLFHRYVSVRTHPGGGKKTDSKSPSHPPRCSRGYALPYHGDHRRHHQRLPGRGDIEGIGPGGGLL